MDLKTAQNTTTAKLPILKQGEYDMWRLRIEQYFQVQDYALWDVIENRNSFIPAAQTTTNADVTLTTLIPGFRTTEEKVQKKNDIKERGMLLMALSNEHLMTFIQYKDVKTLFAAIQTRFSGNKATKKTQKTLLKQMYENFSAPSTESLDYILTGFRRFLPFKWNTHVVVWRNKLDLDTMSFDDLYNNFKIVKQEVKGTTSSSSSSSSQNMAFVSSLSSTNEVNTIYGVDNHNQIEDRFHINHPSKSRMWGVEDGRSREGLFSPSKLDLSNSDLEEFQQPEFEGYGPKTSNSVREDISNKVKESPDTPLVKELVSDDKVEKKIVFPTAAKIEFVRPKQQENPVRKPVNTPMLYSAAMYKFGGVTPIFLSMKKLMVDMLPLVETLKEVKSLAKVKSVQKNSVLFTDTKCVVLSPDFKLLNESQVLLRVPRKNNMVLVIKPHNKTLYELFHGKTPSLSFMRPFGCPVTILNTLDTLGKFDRKDDEGFFVGYSVNSKSFRVFNSRTKIVDENLHITFLENKPNVARSGPTWLFNIDTLTKSMNYKPVVVGNQYNGSAGKARMETVPDKYYLLLPLWTQYPLFSFSSKDSPGDGFKPLGEEEKKDAEDPMNEDNEVLSTKEPRVNQENNANVNSTNYINSVSLTDNVSSIKDNDVDKDIVYECFDDPNMPNLEEINYSDDEDVGAEADMTNLDSNIPVNPILTTRIHKDNPVEQIIRDIHSAPQIRRMTKNVTNYGFQVTPIVSHLHGVKRIFRYLKGQPKLGLWYPKDSPFDLEAYTNSDYAVVDVAAAGSGCSSAGKTSSSGGIYSGYTGSGNIVTNSRVTPSWREIVSLTVLEYLAMIHVRSKLHYFPLIKDRLNEDRPTLFHTTCLGPWLDITYDENDDGMIHYVIQKQCCSNDDSFDLPLIYDLLSFRMYRNGDIPFRNQLFPERIGYDVKIIDVLALLEDEKKFSKVSDEDVISYFHGVEKGQEAALSDHVCDLEGICESLLTLSKKEETLNKVGLQIKDFLQTTSEDEAKIKDDTSPKEDVGNVYCCDDNKDAL
nr:phospholipase-like, aminotransferase-like mobile domain protein [Tanacetum cinerariifolium]